MMDLQVVKVKQYDVFNKLVSERKHTLFGYCCILNVFFAGFSFISFRLHLVPSELLHSKM